MHVFVPVCKYTVDTVKHILRTHKTSQSQTHYEACLKPQSNPSLLESSVVEATKTVRLNQRSPPKESCRLNNLQVL